MRRSHQAACAEGSSFSSGMFRPPPGHPPWRHGGRVRRDQPRGVPPRLPAPSAAGGSAPSVPATKRRKLEQAPGYTELHAAVGRPVPSRRSPAGPTPTQEINLLAELSQAGTPVHQLLDDIALSRARAALARESRSSYASHVRMISWACSLLGEMPLPASLDLILRVSALINNPNTLRVWLAAWRDWHIQEREFSPGDQNPFLRRVRKGTERLAPRPAPRGRLRFPLWRTVLQLAAKKDLIAFGALCNLAYIFAARVPSEILNQCRWCNLVIDKHSLTYRDVIRKGKPGLSTLRRFCVCSKDELLCFHVWLAALKEIRNELDGSRNLLFSFSAQSVSNTLQSLLLECGLAADEAARFTTHCFRRGAGVDVLEAEGTTCSLLAGDRWRRLGMYGLPGMLCMGEWSSKASATHYASVDEQSCAGMAFNILEASDDEH